MLLSDVYLISGCPYYVDHPSPCSRVIWVKGSSLIFVKGQPVLTMESIGLCQTDSGAMQGLAIIAPCQLGIFEPESPTFINE